MAKSILAETFAVSAPGVPATKYDIERVTADPRLAPGLAADLGTIVEYVTAQGSVTLQKYTTWDRGWRYPGGGPLYPNTADLFLGATKITPGALYLDDEMIVNQVYDSSGNGNHLTLNVTPVFQQTLEDKVGIYVTFVSGGKATANVNNPAAASFVWGGEAAYITANAGAISALFGRSEAATAKGYMFYWDEAAAALKYFIKDNAGAAINAAIAGVNMASTPRVPFLVLGQVDIAAGRFRARVCRGGAAVATVDVAYALGTLSAAGQEFGQGAVPGWGAGIWNPYTFYATGAQIEGANVLRDLAVGLGWEV